LLQARKLEDHKQKYERLFRERDLKERQEKAKRVREEHVKAAREQQDRPSMPEDDEPGMGDFFKMMNDPDIAAAFQVNSLSFCSRYELPELLLFLS
jgi:hypothetical protein